MYSCTKKLKSFSDDVKEAEDLVDKLALQLDKAKAETTKKRSDYVTYMKSDEYLATKKHFLDAFNSCMGKEYLIKHGILLADQQKYGIVWIECKVLDFEKMIREDNVHVMLITYMDPRTGAICSIGCHPKYHDTINSSEIRFFPNNSLGSLQGTQEAIRYTYPDICHNFVYLSAFADKDEDKVKDK